MRIDREAFLLLTAALAGCRTPPHDAPKVGPDTRAAAPSPSPSNAPSALCDELRKANLAEAKKATGACVAEPRTTFPMVGDVTSARKDLDAAAGDGRLACREAKGANAGAWGLELHDARLSAPSMEGVPHCGWKARAELVFQAPDGARSRIDLGEMVSAGGPLTTRVALREVFDFDGDHRAEAVLEQAAVDLDGCPEPAALRVLQAAPQGIRDYPVGAHFTDVLDADGDGRPDLVDETFYLSHDRIGGMCGATPVRGAPILLHSLRDGTFSRTDGVARAFARAQCPSKPKLPHDDVPCARIWGESEASVRKDVEAAFPKPAGSFDADPRGMALEFAPVAPPFAPLSTDTPAPLAGVERRR